MQINSHILKRTFLLRWRFLLRIEDFYIFFTISETSQAKIDLEFLMFKVAFSLQEFIKKIFEILFMWQTHYLRRNSWNITRVTIIKIIQKTNQINLIWTLFVSWSPSTEFMNDALENLPHNCAESSFHMKVFKKLEKASNNLRIKIKRRKFNKEIIVGTTNIVKYRFINSNVKNSPRNFIKIRKIWSPEKCKITKLSNI